MEYRKPKKEINISEEYTKQAAEYMPPENEYTAKNDEYHPLSNEFYIGKSETTQKKKKKTSAFKKIRQMGYLVASSAAVVMTVHTVTPDVLEVVGSEFDYVVQDEYEMDDVEIDDVIVDVQDDIYSDVSNENIVENESVVKDAILVDENYYFSGYACNGGVMLGQKDEKMWLLNTKGEVLCGDKYDGGYFHSPNAIGYSVVSSAGLATENEKIYYILDNYGNEVFVAQTSEEFDILDVYISEEKIVTIQGFNHNGFTQLTKYYSIDGNLIYTAKGYTPPFNDGYAVVEDGYIIDEMGKQKTSKLVNVLGKALIPPRPANDGYFLAEEYDENLLAFYSLVNVATGEKTEPIDQLTLMLRDYWKNGMLFCHYKTYGCTGSAIYDFRDCVEYDQDGSIKLKTIAEYDYIIFDNFKYLAAQDGQNWFYIDFEGNIVSKKYVRATQFNDKGYAVVVDEGNAAYIIDSNFEIYHTFKNVSIGTNCLEFYGDAFKLIQCENGKDIEAIYVFDTFTNKSAN